MNHYSLLLSISLAVCSLQPVLADEIMTPVGVVKTPCLPNSDTIVGLPTRQNAIFEGTLSADPSIWDWIEGGQAALFIPGWDPDLYPGIHQGRYYAKFSNSSPSAAGDGQWFTTVDDDHGTIVVDLNGGSIDAVAGAKVEILKFWTLNELFPPSECTTDAATTGNAMVAAEDPYNPDSRLFLYDYSGNGINLVPSTVCIVHDGVWYDENDLNGGDIGNTRLWPDLYFGIRHSSGVTQATTYTSIGEVEVGDFEIPLHTLTSGQQDNLIAIPRPIDVSLNDLNLGGTTAFVDSLGELPADRKDELRVYDNTQAMINKSPSAIYYRHNGIWKKEGAGSTDVGEDVIPKAAGFIIRKAQTVDGVTHIWKNTPSYPAP